MSIPAGAREVWATGEERCARTASSRGGDAGVGSARTAPPAGAASASAAMTEMLRPTWPGSAPARPLTSLERGMRRLAPLARLAAGENEGASRQNALDGALSPAL